MWKQHTLNKSNTRLQSLSHPIKCRKWALKSRFVLSCVPYCLYRAQKNDLKWLWIKRSRSNGTRMATSQSICKQIPNLLVKKKKTQIWGLRLRAGGLINIHGTGIVTYVEIRRCKLCINEAFFFLSLWRWNTAVANTNNDWLLKSSGSRMP